MQFADSKSNVHQERLVRVALTGTGAADPVVSFGPSMTVTHQATGVYRITLKESFGQFVGIGGYVFGAATAADVKGQTLTHTTWDATNRIMDVSVWSSTFAADDLQLTEYLNLSLVFAGTNKP